MHGWMGMLVQVKREAAAGREEAIARSKQKQTRTQIKAAAEASMNE